MKTRCVEGCSSGSSLQSHDEGGFGHEGVYAMTQFNRHSGYGTRTPGSQSIEMSGSGSGVGGSISSRSGGGGGGTRGSTVNMTGKPSTAGLANLAGLLSSSQSPITTTNSPQASVDSNNLNDNSPMQHRVLVGFSSKVFYVCACVFCIIKKIPLLHTEKKGTDPRHFFLANF